jgi:hypothetical protein
MIPAWGAHPAKVIFREPRQTSDYDFGYIQVVGGEVATNSGESMAVRVVSRGQARPHTQPGPDAESRRTDRGRRGLELDQSVERGDRRQ